MPITYDIHHVKLSEVTADSYVVSNVLTAKSSSAVVDSTGISKPEKVIPKLPDAPAKVTKKKKATAADASAGPVFEPSTVKLNMRVKPPNNYLREPVAKKAAPAKQAAAKQVAPVRKPVITIGDLPQSQPRSVDIVLEQRSQAAPVSTVSSSTSTDIDFIELPPLHVRQPQAQPQMQQPQVPRVSGIPASKPVKQDITGMDADYNNALRMLQLAATKF